MHRAVNLLTKFLLAGLSSVLGLGVGSCGSKPKSKPRRDVVVVMIDTLRADALESYGCESETSPNLEAFALEGVQFENALAPAPWTGPSVSSLITGRYPDELGMVGLLSPLPEGAPVLAEVFRDAGYLTGAVVSNGVAGPAYGHDRGYKTYFYKSYKKVIKKKVLKIPDFTADKVTDEALRILEEWESSSPEPPRFLFVHYTDPHEPYLAPVELREKFLDGLDLLDEGYLLSKGFVEGPLPPEGLERLWAHYLAEVAFTDRQIGRLLERIPETSLVVVTSDHGEEFKEHGRFLHGHSLFQELLHIPLLVRGPGLLGGAKVERPVSLVDLAPTLLEWAEIEVSNELSGDSLLPLLMGQGETTLEPRPIYAMLETQDTRLKIIREGSWKLGFFPGGRRRILYDLGGDPTETKSVVRGHRDVADLLLEKIKLREDRLAPLVSREDPREKKRRLEALRAIGYVEEDP